ncbi:VOC family protein [Sphingomonas sp. IC081]|uniref:Extradiol dioxygenase n=1 Tax=Sphingomonas sp. CB3 TaxID=76582 RepID=O85288_9SPHN|nr:VOC family protein [Sphingomonas sp. IC081]AAC38621.1 extradiol dioxygenase [Sphingomonas sp. CB3]
MPHIRALGYVGFETLLINEWKHFATEILGLQIGEELADGTLVLRSDSYKARIFLHPGPSEDILYAGWETFKAEELQALRDNLTARGIPFTEGSESEARARCVLELIRFKDADGNVVEAFFGATEFQHEPFISPKGVTFITGQQGFGHIVLSTDDYEGQVKFYHETLGFLISDYNDLLLPGRPPAHITFFHVNGRHHSLALGNMPLPKRFNHFMLEASSLDDVGFALDRAKNAGAHILMDLGRHSNDKVISFYVMTPSGWAVEFGWGSLIVDDEIWHVTHHPEPSIWGHKFTPPAHI